MSPEDWWSEWNEMYPPIDVAVCITHRRFIPCRTDDGCVISVQPEHIEMVQKYQWGDTPD